MLNSLHLLAVALSLTFVCFAVALKEIVCGTVDMRNSPMTFLQDPTVAKKISQCTVVEGNVHVLLMVRENITTDKFSLVRFPVLREITGHLVIFQLRVLKSLDVIFPELRVIRGDQLIHNYAFVMSQNADMEEIGLHKLTEISRGGARIIQNPNLCYVDTVNWQEISKEPPFIEHNKQPNMCSDRCDKQKSVASLGQTEKSQSNSKDLIRHSQLDDKLDFDDCALRPEPLSNLTACWNSKTCQKVCQPKCRSRGLSCSDVKEDLCCHAQCIGGCSGPTDEDCYVCRSVFHINRCLPDCPPDYFKLKNRRCITKDECESRIDHDSTGLSDDKLYKAIDVTGVCSQHCPIGYEEDPKNLRKCRMCPSNVGCTKTCTSLSNIQSESEAQTYKGCNVMLGYLDIEIHSGMSKNIVQSLGEYLSDLKEVTQYVKISFTPSFVALDFLKNLRVIRGQELYREKYALSVLGNVNLARLWNPRFNSSDDVLTIQRGGVQFHNNHLLCYNLIDEFVSKINMSENVTEHDVSKNSNGERAICEKNKLNLRIVFVSDDMVVCGWKPFNTSNVDHRLLLGYQVYYKEVQSKVLDIYENRDACSDSWQMVFHPPNTDGSALRQLKPNSLYGLYVRTLMVDSAGSGAISDVAYATTLFQAPSSVVLQSAKSFTSDSIDISWKPPRFPNGQVTHYKITYQPKMDYLPKERDYCIEPPDYNRKSDEFMDDEDPSFLSESANDSSETCPSLKCCNCKRKKEKIGPNSERERIALEKVAFENAIQNTILPTKRRSKRHLDTDSYFNDEFGPEHSEKSNGAQNDTENLLFFMSMDKQKVTSLKSHFAPNSKYNDLAKGQTIPTDFHTLNVSTLNVTLTGLKHFTAYEIKIWACQNISVPVSYCSNVAVYRVRRTLMIESKDTVDDASVKIIGDKENLSHKRIIWKPPLDPNGLVVSYEVEYLRDISAKLASKTECISAISFNESVGIFLTDLLPGNYSLRVRAITLAQRGPQTAQVFFDIPQTFRFSNTAVALLAISCSLAALVSGILLVAALYRRWISKKYPEYLLGIFSANPDYISQIEVYKKDAWELDRDSIQLLQEIGRGSFGTVFKGQGLAVLSKCGTEFGECAVKTVAKTATLYDRFHFLAEASIMKSMKTRHVVKLYGVVSDGQPALVVMEYMAEGNLKEHLMKRRPENNNFDEYSTPTLIEVLRMACEIADGMAYLAAKRFCHRDLAARNCMVAADMTVKIGDFGMTRDLQIKDYYRPCGRRLMPVRWMSPEAIEFARFSTQSDVWSYGVVLWEIVTLASQPYPGLSNDDVRKFVVEDKFILKMPNGCPPQLWDLMVRCWQYLPDNRPTFEDIIPEFLPLINETSFDRDSSFYYSQRGMDLDDEDPYGSSGSESLDMELTVEGDKFNQQTASGLLNDKIKSQKSTKIGEKYGSSWLNSWFCPSQSMFEKYLQRSDGFYGIGFDIKTKTENIANVSETPKKDFLFGHRIPSPFALLIWRWPSNLRSGVVDFWRRIKSRPQTPSPSKIRHFAENCGGVSQKAPDQSTLLSTIETLEKV